MEKLIEELKEVHLELEADQPQSENSVQETTQQLSVI
jgi:hypothetical protein